MRRDDAIRVRHMLEAAREAVGFTQGVQRRDLASNRMLVLSLVKSIEIIGEAASTVTAETRQLHPSIPWRDMTAMRNRLIHVYFDIDLDRVWDTITDDLPKLIAQLDAIVEK